MADYQQPLLPKQSSSWFWDPAVWGSVGNLSMTTVGAVVLSLPAAMAETGWIFGTFLLILFAGLADLSNIFLLNCGKNTGLDDYEKIGAAYLGRWGGLAIRISLILLLVGALTSINVIVVDMMSANLDTFGVKDIWYSSRWFISLANIVVMWPLAMFEQVYQLRHVSILAFFAIVYVLGAVFYRCGLDLTLPAGHPDRSSTADEHQDSGFDTFSFSNRTFLALPVLAMAYCAQFQVLPVYHSLPVSSREHMKAIVHLSYFAVAMPIYIAFALLPYFVLGSSVSSDFLFSAWKSSGLMSSARVLLAVVNSLKYPLVSMPLRDILLDLVWHGHDPQDVTWKERGIIMCVINSVVMVATCYAHGLGQVVDLIGSSSGSLVCFVFPSLLFLCMSVLPRPLSCASLIEEDEVSAEAAATRRWDISKLTWVQVAAGVMFLCGVGVGVLAFVFTITLDPL